jgi:hypothetical protein
MRSLAGSPYSRQASRHVVETKKSKRILTSRFGTASAMSSGFSCDSRNQRCCPLDVRHSVCPKIEPFQLLDDVKFDLCETRSNHSQRISRGVGNIDNSSGNIGTTVIDPNCHGLSAGDVRHAQFCAERQRRMSGCQILRIELFAARSLCSVGGAGTISIVWDRLARGEKVATS